MRGATWVCRAEPHTTHVHAHRHTRAWCLSRSAWYVRQPNCFQLQARASSMLVLWYACLECPTLLKRAIEQGPNIPRERRSFQRGQAAELAAVGQEAVHLPAASPVPPPSWPRAPPAHHKPCGDKRQAMLSNASNNCASSTPSPQGLWGPNFQACNVNLTIGLGDYQAALSEAERRVCRHQTTSASSWLQAHIGNTFWSSATRRYKIPDTSCNILGRLCHGLLRGVLETPSDHP